MTSQFVTNDGVSIVYSDTDPQNGEGLECLILLHGFTGSKDVWQKNIPALRKTYRVIVPDLRGHGDSQKPEHGYHVSRLAMDLHELTQHIINSSATSQKGTREDKKFLAIGGSLGCAILWSYAELFGTSLFKKMVFVDQSPLQNSTLDGWDSRFCNRGMNNPWAIASLQKTLELAPEIAHRGTIAACLGYRYAPLESEKGLRAQKEMDDDEAFFLREALKGHGRWLGKLMEDHTSKDWRDSIRACFGSESGSETEILVVGSSRSGCFPAEGVLKIVEFINGGMKMDGKTGEGKARGVVVDWGGHWCYWEEPDKFNNLVFGFFGVD
ncbi:putative alpha beta hydrolase fold protein [Botrytis fragariae]|uniref:Putative alpha beta hydrolase fold protein n=1 Tax=Botrytis fragariae TaxID=1964551 RepID=A0A8H6APF6_9HELO|nr:putative alpha beta hydrolase fold protein [Botrytis fragariae]KAF5871252.1 putative alpha beta hydrolase fold protein [Botrytis fragariae]